MIGWLYRYIFRGWGVLLIVGIITILALAYRSQAHHPSERAVTAPVAAQR
jgi:hypothetical protein